MTATRTDSLPGMPDGHYALIRFRTRFAHKVHASEMVTLTADGGRWQPIGYFVR